MTKREFQLRSLVKQVLLAGDSEGLRLILECLDSNLLMRISRDCRRELYVPEPQNKISHREGAVTLAESWRPASFEFKYDTLIFDALVGGSADCVDIMLSTGLVSDYMRSDPQAFFRLLQHSSNLEIAKTLTQQHFTFAPNCCSYLLLHFCLRNKFDIAAFLVSQYSDLDFQYVLKTFNLFEEANRLASRLRSKISSVTSIPSNITSPELFTDTMESAVNGSISLFEGYRMMLSTIEYSQMSYFMVELRGLFADFEDLYMVSFDFFYEATHQLSKVLIDWSCLLDPAAVIRVTPQTPRSLHQVFLLLQSYTTVMQSELQDREYFYGSSRYLSSSDGSSSQLLASSSSGQLLSGSSAQISSNRLKLRRLPALSLVAEEASSPTETKVDQSAEFSQHSEGSNPVAGSSNDLLRNDRISRPKLVRSSFSFSDRKGVQFELSASEGVIGNSAINRKLSRSTSKYNVSSSVVGQYAAINVERVTSALLSLVRKYCKTSRSTQEVDSLGRSRLHMLLEYLAFPQTQGYEIQDKVAKVLEFLIKDQKLEPAFLNLKDKRGLRPFDYALYAFNGKAAWILLKYGASATCDTVFDQVPNFRKRSRVRDFEYHKENRDGPLNCSMLPLTSKISISALDYRGVVFSADTTGPSASPLTVWEINTASRAASSMANVAVRKGKWFYQVQLMSAGVVHIGWAVRDKHKPTDTLGVGQDLYSWSFNGKEKCFNEISEEYPPAFPGASPMSNRCKWQVGTVIGCMLDLDSNKMSFFADGFDLGVAFNVEFVPKTAVKGQGLSPALTLSPHQRVRVMFNPAVMSLSTSSSELWKMPEGCEDCHPLECDTLRTKDVNVNASFVSPSNVTPGIVWRNAHFEIAEYISHFDESKNIIAQINKSIDQKDNKQTPFWSACDNGRADVLKFLRDFRADINHPNELGQTPFHWACSTSNLGLIQLLHELGSDVNRPNYAGQSPLYVACHLGLHTVVHLLMDLRKPSVDIPGLAARQLPAFLLAAVKQGHLDTVKLLLSFPYILELKNETDQYGKTCFFWACESGHFEVAKYLFTLGVDINRADNWGQSPFFIACRVRNIEMAQFLIGLRDLGQLHLDINSKENEFGRSPLNYACWEGSIEIVKFLLDFGADVHSESHCKTTPFHSACQHDVDEEQQLAILHMLVQHKADINKPDQNGSTPFNTASSIMCTTKLIEGLVEMKAEIFKRDNQGNTALISACRESRVGQSHIIHYLISLGHEVNAFNLAGETALHVACNSYEVETVNLLLSLGAQIFSKTLEQETCFFVACKSGSLKIVSYLAHVEPKLISLPDKGGHSPFWIACCLGRLEVVKFFIDRGWDDSKPDNRGVTPLGAAQDQLICFNTKSDSRESPFLNRSELMAVTELLSRKQSESATTEDPLPKLWNISSPPTIAFSFARIKSTPVVDDAASFKKLALPAIPPLRFFSETHSQSADETPPVFQPTSLLQEATGEYVSSPQIKWDDVGDLPSPPNPWRYDTGI